MRDSITVLNEFFKVASGRRSIQAGGDSEDLDGYLDRYNNERTNQGARCQRRTPIQTFRESLHLAKEKMLDEMRAVNATCQLFLDQDKAATFEVTVAY